MPRGQPWESGSTRRRRSDPAADTSAFATGMPQHVRRKKNRAPIETIEARIARRNRVGEQVRPNCATPGSRNVATRAATRASDAATRATRAATRATRASDVSTRAARAVICAWHAATLASEVVMRGLKAHTRLHHTSTHTSAHVLWHRPPTRRGRASRRHTFRR